MTNKTNATDNELPRTTLITYAMPWVGGSFISYLLGLYFFKFATDTLLIAPATIGAIFAIARVWDAVSDPMVGYLSDRTPTRHGRRRPWWYASVLPMALVPVLLWSPPAALEGLWMMVWLLVWIIAYETALTMFLIPGMALGAELTINHHERTRVFAYRQAFWAAGNFLCVGAVYLLIAASDRREMAFWLSLAGGCIAALLIVFSATRLRERASHQNKQVSNPVQAVKDVWANPYARLLMLVFTAESLGMATLGVLAPFYMQYVIGSEQFYTALLLCHLVPSLLIIPIAVRLSRWIGKPKLWGVATLISSVSFAAFYFAGPGDLAYVLVWVVAIGIATGTSQVVGPSVQADVVDYDEMVTGERKEGSYFALWNFLRKAGAGVVGALAGIVLQMVGFEPNVEQTELTREAIRLMYAIWPALLTGLAGIVFLARFRLDHTAHERIRRTIDERQAKEPAL